MAIKRFLIDSNLYISILLLIIIALSLYSSDILIYKTLSPYFFYSTGVSVFLMYSAAIAILFNNKNKSLSPSLPLLMIIALGSYVLIRTSLSTTAYPYSFYLLCNCCFFIALTLVLKLIKPNLLWLFSAILLCASFESVVCILQYFNIVGSLNSYFAATGTWDNPNVTAMFIAMAVPAACSLFKLNKRQVSWIAGGLLILLFIALLTLKCRTALIGAAVALIIILNARYALLQKFRDKKHRSLSILATVFLIGSLAPILLYAYQAKKASADGRKLVWKISTSMISHEPITGYGYGSFEKNYNLFQSKYFESEEGTPDENQNAGYVRVAYNEFLQNTVEGGLIGSLLIFGLFLSLLMIPKNWRSNAFGVSNDENTFVNNVTAYSGVTAFIIMSLFNFTIQAIPVLCIFIIYSAILSYDLPAFYFNNINVRSGIVSYSCGIILLILGCYGFYTTLNFLHYNMQNKEALLLTNHRDYNASLSILAGISPHLNTYESYWNNYANTLVLKKDYRDAVIKFEKVKSLTSNPIVYINTGLAYEKVGDMSKARENFLIAKFMEPNRLTPRFDLMNLYIQMNDTVNSITEAKNIIITTPRILSGEADLYKRAALSLMKKLGHPYDYNLPKRRQSKPLYFSNR